MISFHVILFSIDDCGTVGVLKIPVVFTVWGRVLQFGA